MPPIEVPAEHTGGNNTAEWRASRRPLFVCETARWLGWPEAAGWLAPLFVAHSRNETGAGRAEFCFNLGGIRSFASREGETAYRRSGYLWRAYPRLRAGVNGYLSVMLGHPGRLAACLEFLQHGDPERWYRDAILGTGYDNAESAVPTFVGLWRLEHGLPQNG